MKDFKKQLISEDITAINTLNAMHDRADSILICFVEALHEAGCPVKNTYDLRAALRDVRQWQKETILKSIPPVFVGDLQWNVEHVYNGLNKPDITKAANLAGDFFKTIQHEPEMFFVFDYDGGVISTNFNKMFALTDKYRTYTRSQKQNEILKALHAFVEAYEVLNNYFKASGDPHTMNMAGKYGSILKEGTHGGITFRPYVIDQLSK